MASARYGIRFANTHMSGDRSINTFIRMIADAQQQYGPASTKNWASDHCVLVNPADIPQAARLGVVFSCYSSPINNGAEIARNYGDKVAQTFISPVKTMVDAGIHVAYEQENSNVWQGLSLFMTRKDRDGKVWGPQERIDHPTALKMATIWSAEYVLKPDKLGSIEKGKLAEYNHELFRLYWTEGRDLSKDDVLKEAVSGIGIDPEWFIARIGEQEIKDRLREETSKLAARGAFGAPTIFIGDKMFWGNDRLGFVEDYLKENP